MSERENSETIGRRQRKNQKNIYVHKIKSLMRISQDNLLQDEKDISVAINKKQIKKARSEGNRQTIIVDKTAIKLEKNRESAKRARLRKKFYINLLEKRVELLREAAQEGTRIERDCLKFLQLINSKQGKKERADQIVDQVERYLSSENLTRTPQEQLEKEKRFARMDKLVEEICQISMCSSLRNVRQLSSQISLEEIIKAQEESLRQLQSQQLQEIIKEVLVEAENLRNIYGHLMAENDNVKRSVTSGQQLKREELEGNRQERFPEDFSSCAYRSAEKGSIFINLSEAQKTLIQGQSYLDQINQYDEA